ncbi:hypothetical protein [Bacillus thuringiensis]|uniref:Lipoprotein n=1 Tax=Bacillus thuringiensis TaxID=1428 RepID=A0A9X6ZR22_BACTU|nr:hypothetical protein [Bacillus thuringiensis]PFJ33171.1 hypothetical protein COJ15_28425 [Bacillus thuringiensis]
MKKTTFLITALCTGLLFGCNNKEVHKESNTETESKIDKKQNDSTSNSKKINTSGKTRFESLMHDKEGQEYKVSIIAVKEKKQIETENLAGATQGDAIYNGDYKVVLSKNGKVKQEVKVNNLTFNANSSHIELVKGKVELLLITQTESTNNNWGYAFIVKGDSLVQVKNGKDNSDSFMYSEAAFKEVEPYHYESAFYNNMEGKWVFTIYKLNEEKATLTPSNVEVYEFEEGTKYYNTYFVDNKN